MLLFEVHQDRSKLTNQREDLRAYRVIEALVAAKGITPPKPGVIFPSLASLSFDGNVEDIDPEDSFRQVTASLSSITGGPTLFG